MQTLAKVRILPLCRVAGGTENWMSWQGPVMGPSIVDYLYVLGECELCSYAHIPRCPQASKADPYVPELCF